MNEHKYIITISDEDNKQKKLSYYLKDVESETLAKMTDDYFSVFPFIEDETRTFYISFVNVAEIRTI